MGDKVGPGITSIGVPGTGPFGLFVMLHVLFSGASTGMIRASVYAGVYTQYLLCNVKVWEMGRSSAPMLLQGIYG